MHDAVCHDALGYLPEPGDETYATLDAQGVLTSWSPGAQRLLGYTADEVRGRRASDLLYTRASASRLVERCRPKETASLSQTVLRHRDGSPVEVGMWVHPLVSTSGEPLRLIQAYSSDAMRRRNLDLPLLNGLFTESPFHIDVFDTQLHFVAQNARRLKGFRDRDVFGRTLREVAPAGLLDMDAFEARQREVLATGEALVGTEVHAGTPDDPDGSSLFGDDRSAARRLRGSDRTGTRGVRDNRASPGPGEVGACQRRKLEDRRHA